MREGSRNIVVPMLKFLFILALLSSATVLWAQRPDTLRQIVVPSSTTGAVTRDSSEIEDAPLDIGQDRGLYILSADKKLQLRILGSVRYLVVLDGLNLENQQSLNPWDLPTGTDNQPVPTYYNGLSQSRLGFEATRRTEQGDIFIRLETDFNGEDGFQIRHAYGQFKEFIVGQTWSLFSQLRALPATVDLDGPTGAVTLRTPQMRWTPEVLLKDILPERTRVSFSLEFPEHNFTPADSSQITALQFLPDPALRIERPYDWGSIQVSAVVPILAGRYRLDGSLGFRMGWGLLAAGEYRIDPQSRLFTQGAIGQSISAFFSTFAGQGVDLVTGTTTDQVYQPLTVSGYVTYERDWESWLTSNLSAGLITLESRAWVPGDQFQWGYSVLANTFWSVVEGARVGAELSVAGRIDVDGSHGVGTRGSALFYYDF